MSPALKRKQPATTGPVRVVSLSRPETTEGWGRCQAAAAFIRGHVLVMEAKGQAASLDEFLAKPPGQRGLVQYKAHTEVVKGAALILRPPAGTDEPAVALEMWQCPDCRHVFDRYDEGHLPCEAATAEPAVPLVSGTAGDEPSPGEIRNAAGVLVRALGCAARGADGYQEPGADSGTAGADPAADAAWDKFQAAHDEQAAIVTEPGTEAPDFPPEEKPFAPRQDDPALDRLADKVLGPAEDGAE